MNRLTLAIADDHVLFREGLIAILSGDDRLCVVGQAGDGDDAVELVRRSRPAMLLLDVSMPGRPASSTIATVKRLNPAPLVVILTMHDDRALRNSLLSVGAVAFLSKTMPSLDLIERIVALGDESSRELMTDRDIHSASGVTHREAEVLRLVGEACSNRQIALRLNIAEGTVKRHLNNVFEKLGATSRLDAVKKAALHGIVDLA